jgi:hypothetical protein
MWRFQIIYFFFSAVATGASWLRVCEFDWLIFPDGVGK